MTCMHDVHWWSHCNVNTNNFAFMAGVIALFLIRFPLSALCYFVYDEVMLETADCSTVPFKPWHDVEKLLMEQHSYVTHSC